MWLYIWLKFSHWAWCSGFYIDEKFTFSPWQTYTPTTEWHTCIAKRLTNTPMRVCQAIFLPFIMFGIFLIKAKIAESIFPSTEILLKLYLYLKYFVSRCQRISRKLFCSLDFHQPSLAVFGHVFRFTVFGSCSVDKFYFDYLFDPRHSWDYSVGCSLLYKM